MKKIITLSVILFSFSGLFINSQPLPTDYRDSYIGKYFCNKTCQVVNSAKTGLEIRQDTTTIVVTKDASDSILNIISNQAALKVKLINGNLFSFPQGHWGGRFFSADSIGFSISFGKVCNVCSYIEKKQIN